MSLLSDREAVIALKNAQLQKGQSYNTRKCYRGWMLRYREARRSGICRNLQGFLTYLSTVDRVNPKTVKQALNALKFYHDTGGNAVISPMDYPPMTHTMNITEFPSARIA